MRPVAVVAHRGASGDFPENTAAAFQEAIRLGVDAIEPDVHLTADQRLLVIHDPTVDRTSDGTGRVAEMTMAQLRQLDAGAWKSPRCRGERFLELGEALELMPAHIRLNVHVKAYEADRDVVIPLAVTELVRRGLLEQAFVASDAASLERARQVEPALAICNLSTQPADTYVARSQQLGCRILQPGNGVTDGALVAAAHARGMEDNHFHADDEREMQRLVACGVDGILTNYPARLQELRGRACSRNLLLHRPH
ncbi:MAG: glycerophosphodiester phosphodiesterase family protein [Gemmatimonadota bacterium]